MSTERIYVSKTVGRTHYVYGPFESTDAARVASMLSRPSTEWTGNVDPRVYSDKGVCGYGDDELAQYVAHPEYSGYARFLHRPAKALRPHKSWREHGLDFARSYVARFLRP